MSEPRILGLIPARGGSKGLPGKNTRPLAGKPLIAWTVEAALAAPSLARVVVTTDDEAIAAVARDAGADVPFLRPAELATDDATMIDVVLHATDPAVLGEAYDAVCLLQPTTPLRAAEHIEAAVARLRETGGRAVVSVAETEHSPLWENTLPPDGSMAGFLRPEVENVNRQHIPAYYRLNGAIYLARLDFLAEQRGFIAEGTYAYVMPREASIDIDTLLDFQLAEFLMERRG
jgi:N-acylneuraminate cytidylyltransferase/CMP-N,N'-diacetyllegionaminic acid synthase